MTPATPPSVWPLDCPRCLEPMLNGADMQHHLERTHGVPRVEAAAETVAALRSAQAEAARETDRPDTLARARESFPWEPQP